MIMPPTAYFFTVSQHQNNTEFCVVSGALWIGTVQVQISILFLQINIFAKQNTAYNYYQRPYNTYILEEKERKLV